MKPAWADDDSGYPRVEVSSYDDLSVSAARGGQVVVECPACGDIPVPQRNTTLSDLTNAAMEHLSEKHPYTLTLPSRRSRVAGDKASRRRSRTASSSGYFTERFWSLIALLAEPGGGLDTLVRALASSSDEDIVDFGEQLQSAQAMLDTPQHRVQQVMKLDDPLQTVPGMMTDDEFEQVRLAVVAAGRDTWLDVLADPGRLAGGWSTYGSRALRDAAAAAMQRSTPPRPHLTADGGSGGLDPVDDGLRDVAKLPVLFLGQLGEEVEGLGG